VVYLGKGKTSQYLGKNNPRNCGRMKGVFFQAYICSLHSPLAWRRLIP